MYWKTAGSAGSDLINAGSSHKRFSKGAAGAGSAQGGVKRISSRSRLHLARRSQWARYIRTVSVWETHYVVSHCQIVSQSAVKLRIGWWLQRLNVHLVRNCVWTQFNRYSFRCMLLRGVPRVACGGFTRITMLCHLRKRLRALSANSDQTN